MTTSFKEPIDFYNYSVNFYKSLPKTATEIKNTYEKVQTVMTTEYANSQEVAKAYTKALTGDVTANEIAKANKKAAELVKSATFASMLAVPGALFALPLIVEKAKELKIDIVPTSVAEQFSI